MWGEICSQMMVPIEYSQFPKGPEIAPDIDHSSYFFRWTRIRPVETKTVNVTKCSSEELEVPARWITIFSHFDGEL